VGVEVLEGLGSAPHPGPRGLRRCDRGGPVRPLPPWCGPAPCRSPVRPPRHRAGFTSMRRRLRTLRASRRWRAVSCSARLSRRRLPPPGRRTTPLT